MFVLLLGNIYIRTQGVVYGKYFLSGRQLQFDCVYHKPFYKLVSFEHNGSVISPHFFRRYYIVQTTGDYDALIVSDTLPDDAGFWGCTLEDKRFGHQITAYGAGLSIRDKFQFLTDRYNLIDTGAPCDESLKCKSFAVENFCGLAKNFIN